MQVLRWVKSVFLRDQWEQLKAQLFSDSVFDGAAGLAYYLTLSIFPGLIFVVTLIPYFDFANLQAILSNDLFQYLPTRVASTLQTTLSQVLNNTRTGLMSFSFLGGLFFASTGCVALIRQMNIAYEVREKRSFLQTRIVALVMTLILSLVLLLSLIVIVVGGFFISDFFLSALRWFVILVTVYTALSLIYFIGPDTYRLRKPFRYFTPGSWLGTLLIMLATALLNLYLQFFDNYNKIYGSIAGVIVLMIWFYLIGLGILMGAQLNNFIYKKLALIGRA